MKPKRNPTKRPIKNANLVRNMLQTVVSGNPDLLKNKTVYNLFQYTFFERTQGKFIPRDMAIRLIMKIRDSQDESIQFIAEKQIKVIEKFDSGKTKAA